MKEKGKASKLQYGRGERSLQPPDDQKKMADPPVKLEDAPKPVAAPHWPATIQALKRMEGEQHAANLKTDERFDRN